MTPQPPSTTPLPTGEALTEQVRARYAAAAQAVGQGATCCSPLSSSSEVSTDLYAAAEVTGLPEEAVLASLGCGNPTALADLRPGQVVLDLGSGGGIDVLLAARRVGPTGFVYGLDMTDEMLALALRNQRAAGVTNVAFLRGRIEQIPLPTDAVDVLLSNCVLNLAADKAEVMREAFRVLKPGGRLAVADVVADGELPAGLRSSMEAWVGCLAGALEIGTYERMLVEAGFSEVRLTLTRRYTVAEAGLDPATLPADWERADGRLASAFISAVKPGAAPTDVTPEAPAKASAGAPGSAASCCGGGCCGA